MPFKGSPTSSDTLPLRNDLSMSLSELLPDMDFTSTGILQALIKRFLLLTLTDEAKAISPIVFYPSFKGIGLHDIESLVPTRVKVINLLHAELNVGYPF